MVQRKAVVVTHRRIRSSGNVVSEAVEQLQRSGFTVSVLDNLEAPAYGSQPRVVDDDTEIVVVLGGDGTMLGAAELVKCTNVPIVGINLGHVGFLAEFESFQMSEAIGKIAERDYSIDARMVAHIDVWLPESRQPITDWALNDMTLERSDRGKMVELSIRVNDVEMSSFGCDGVIVATPTGSTAYAFSAGGPIVWPDVQALQMVPLAAHALFARPLIIGSSSTFAFDILDESTSDGWICCDGRRQRWLPKGSRILVRESHDRLRLARLSGTSFTKRLVTKFSLPVIGWRESRHYEGQFGNMSYAQSRGPQESDSGSLGSAVHEPSQNTQDEPDTMPSADGSADGSARGLAHDVDGAAHNCVTGV